MDEEIIIPLSKTKIMLIVFGALVFVAIAFWLLTIADTQTRYPSIYVTVIGWAGILFFGLCGLFGFKKLKDNQPGLIINSQGIIDNSSGVAAGFISWSEVTDLKIAEIQGQKFLTFIVADPQKYMENVNPLLRWIHQANLRMFGSPIQISSNALKINFDKLTGFVNEYYLKYRHQ